MELKDAAQQRLGIELSPYFTKEMIGALLEMADRVGDHRIQEVFKAVDYSKRFRDYTQTTDSCTGEVASLSICANDGLIPGIPNPYVRSSSARLNESLDIIEVMFGTASYVGDLSGATFFWLDTIAAPADPAGKEFGLVLARIGTLVGIPAGVSSVLRNGPLSVDGFLSALSLGEPTGSVNTVTQFIPLVKGWDKVLGQVVRRYGWK